MKKKTGICCDLSFYPKEITVDENSAIALYRILQEAYTNILRHAHATRVQVTLKKEPGNIQLTVYDNGKGIRDDQISNIDALGLISMRERTALLNGTFSINGFPGEGTTLTVSIPLPKNEE